MQRRRDRRRIDEWMDGWRGENKEQTDGRMFGAEKGMLNGWIGWSDTQHYSSQQRMTDRRTDRRDEMAIRR